ncbi:MAG: TetR/AcrR family transcriptional regulator [Lachnospiraceae bacterium]|nr:TetR/AcrR family transcriptional regulator [Lachnospiraceae bacterium]
MYKKLSDEKINNMLRFGISEFADKGFGGASLSSIAGKAGISVGVIYKYFEDKESFFLECVRYSLKDLNNVLTGVAAESDSLKDSIKDLVHTLILYSREHEEENRLYSEIVSGRSEMSVMLAREIEEISAMVYTDLVRKAMDEGMCRKDADPSLFAFFFDNIFMMIQFSYNCEYYRERLKLYCGDSIFEDDERMETELIRFINGALGVMV